MLGAQTDFRGSWSTNQLAAGPYTVRVTQNGYYPATVSNVQVSSDVFATANTTLSTAGTDDFLTKPINQTDLLRRVQALLESRSRDGELERTIAYMDAIDRGNP